MGGLLHLVQRGSTASVPITLLLYDGPLLCGFNVAIKWLSMRHRKNSALQWRASLRSNHGRHGRMLTWFFSRRGFPGIGLRLGVPVTWDMKVGLEK